MESAISDDLEVVLCIRFTRDGWQINAWLIENLGLEHEAELECVHLSDRPIWPLIDGAGRDFEVTSEGCRIAAISGHGLGFCDCKSVHVSDISILTRLCKPPYNIFI